MSQADRWKLIFRLAQNTLPPTPLGCYLWAHPPMENGYGKASVCNQTLLAHRVVGKLVNVNKKVTGFDCSHLCHQRLCVTPSHIELETREENNERKLCQAQGSCRGHAGRKPCLFPGQMADMSGGEMKWLYL